MDLHLYPRPPEDTGIGLQWCAGASQAPLAVVRAQWIPALQAMGVKWVHINDHRGAEPLAEELLAADIMPVVRIHRAAPNPYRLGAEELASVESLVRSGVRYMEFNRRPDRPQTWHRGVLPPQARQLVVEHLIFDLEAILIRGGCPGLPAVDPTSAWDFVADLVRLGREDLLEGPVWQALYNPPLNRPPDFPEDPVHREGAPLSQEAHQRLAEEPARMDPWQGRSRRQINRLRWEAAWAPRADRIGLGLPDSRICFQAHRPAAARIRAALGRSLPLLSIPCGYLVEDSQDPRYPAITPLLHMAYTLELCRIMMGTSQRFPPAPEAYFCTALPMLANRALASNRPARERDAWCSAEWPDGVLPIVAALHQEPKQPRPVPPALAPRREEAQALLLREAPPSRNGADLPLGPGVIQGYVTGGAGATLHLVRAEDGFCLTTVARASGLYRFTALPPGHYTLWVETPPGSRAEDIFLPAASSTDPTPTQEVNLAVYGWGYTVTEDDEGQGLLACTVSLTPDLAGVLSVRVNGPDLANHVLPLARSRGRAAGEMGPLRPGDYTLELLGVPDVNPVRLRAYAGVVPGRRTVVHYLFSRRQTRPRPARSQLRGRVDNGGGAHVHLRDAQGACWETTADKEGVFVFQALPPGVYSLLVSRAGAQVHRERLGLDGRNHLEVDCALPLPDDKIQTKSSGALEGIAPHAAGRAAVLFTEDGPAWVHRVDEAGRFRFPHTPPGVYTLIVGDVLRRGLVVRPGETLTVRLLEDPAQPG